MIDRLFLYVYGFLFLALLLPRGSQTYTPKTSAELQQAINQAQAGDVITLQPGLTYQGTFKLPAKSGQVTLRAASELPGRRITAGDVALLPTLVSGSDSPAIDCTGAENWLLNGIRFEANLGGLNTVIACQDAKAITFDRLLFQAPENIGQRRFLLMNGQQMTLTRSYCAGVYAQSLQDSQCVAAWDGAGPYTITDNYLEAASENILFGGADSKSVDRIPSDIVIANNLVTKCDCWRGKPRAVKNLLEFKAAKRVIVRDNVFENVWAHEEDPAAAQDGYAIQITPRNQDGAAPFTSVEDVTFINNTIRNAARGINILGYDNEHPSRQARNIDLRNNLVVTRSTALQIGGQAGSVGIDHVTVANGGTFLSLYKGDIWRDGSAKVAAGSAVESLTLTNTLAFHNEYGVKADGGGIGTVALQEMAKGYTWSQNVLAGGYPYPYPDGTLRPTVEDHEAQFTADYTLVADSMYRGAGTDGSDLGANLEADPTPPNPPPLCTPPTLKMTGWPTLNKPTQLRADLRAKGSKARLIIDFDGTRAVSATLADGPCQVTVTR